MLYELHLQGIDGVDDRWEWESASRRGPAAAGATVRRRYPRAPGDRVAAARGRFGDDVVAALWEMNAPTREPGLSDFMARTRCSSSSANCSSPVAETSCVRLTSTPSASPHGRGPKAALLEIQIDEYGQGRLDRMHSRLFATTMRELGRSDAYAHYLDAVSPRDVGDVECAVLFRGAPPHLGALVGHLCAIETTSALPSKKYSAGLHARYGSAATLFFDEHVRRIPSTSRSRSATPRGRSGERSAELLDDVLLGAAACLALDDLLGEHVTDCWSRGGARCGS
ncbi:iron-containing redox enzyme family protein [Rhodococcus hoagii]|nr:iron-containing redox enzyme family protein [Prescottella equi]